MNTLRLCEWSSVSASAALWPRERREAIQEAAEAWRVTHRLNALPLAWGGVDGRTLSSRQWVGVVEVEGGRVEVYPKTDKALLHKSAPDASEAQSTLHTLLRLLEASNYGEWVETDRAALDVAELSFVDLWAYLLGRHLWPQLRRGLPSAYLPHEDDLTTVRGRILVGRQIGRYQDRFDRMVCAWDEFSPDTALLRLLKCACRLLRRRVSHPLAMGLLGDCLFMLDEVADVPAADALRATERLAWTRATERFRPTFQLARRILAGKGPRLQAGQENTWVFLVDMNQVFEAFVRVALEDKFKIVVEEQQSLGHLFQNPFRLKQLPDYLWKHDGRAWIGDAKWKLLAGEIAEDDGAEAPVANARLAPADVRQLTTYAELMWRKQNKESGNSARPELAVFYPGVSPGATTQVLETWNDTWLHLVPVAVTGWASPKDALPTGFESLSQSQISPHDAGIDLHVLR